MDYIWACEADDVAEATEVARHIPLQAFTDILHDKMDVDDIAFVRCMLASQPDHVREKYENGFGMAHSFMVRNFKWRCMAGNLEFAKFIYETSSNHGKCVQSAFRAVCAAEGGAATAAHLRVLDWLTTLGAEERDSCFVTAPEYRRLCLAPTAALNRPVLGWLFRTGRVGAHPDRGGAKRAEAVIRKLIGDLRSPDSPEDLRAQFPTADAVQSHIAALLSALPESALPEFARHTGA